MGRSPPTAAVLLLVLLGCSAPPPTSACSFLVASFNLTSSKNSEYKKPVADYLRGGAFPNHWKAKIGFTPLGQPVADAPGAPPETRKTGRRRLG